MTDQHPPSSGGGEGNVRVVGTAHVSETSVERVEEAIEEDQPEIVAVELDEGRYRQMQGEVADDLDPSDLLHGNTVFQFLAYWMLSYVQSRMGEEFDIQPGADMKAAIDAAERHGSGVALVDRDIQMTIQRFWARMSAREKLRMVGSLALGVTDPLTIGLIGGAVFGVFFAMIFGIFLSPLLGLNATLTLGAGSGALQLVGGLGGGTVAGLVLGSLALSVGLTRRIDIALGGGLVLGIVGGLAVGTGALGVVSAGTLVGIGGVVLRILTSLAVGVGIGMVLGVLGGVLLGSGTVEEEELDEEFDIEDLTDGDVVTAMMEEFRRFSPGGAEALIDERDAFIAHKLVALREAGHDVIAVVGAGHRAGIESYLANPSTLPPMESLVGTEKGKRLSLFKFFGYFIMVAFFAFFILLAMAGVRNTFLIQVFAAWFLFNGVFAFGLAKLAGAHWGSALVGGAIAWLTSINPLLAPGWFAGYMELKYTQVNIADIAKLNDIMSDEELPLADVMSRMLDVPLFRLIAVVAMTNVGSMIATALFPFVVLPFLGPQIGGVDEITRLMVEGAHNSADLIWGVLT
ncbi:TraB family protein [Haladaptatus paucihalophilus DX253]|uniref:TraB family protein n=1 Tax=Haladaptatus paucihalophilus DX253 TaxID=797209 RepID=E7QUU1_HALPU|nr:TraB/GumN family protein [Haladaptatus paucihalophilus]EFW91748.1 TraB family protein [Haladaptatus paucihalophilus DX253]SHJ95175.1 TraB family protein [Haladaptatus paucihalophilus DX253]